ncbi:acyl carrier protein [Castellaniella hirudinis]|uniref:acyl carrier protein n=1 Tax=Castellaniella hirudinis TaxID=1144617 RepID=UPI0039C38EA3
MDRQQVESAVVKIVSTVLKEQISLEASRAALSTWDSLKHVEIMFALEDEFGIAFSEKELSDLDNVSEIIDRIVGDEA